MTARRALVLDGGDVKELPSDDTLIGFKPFTSREETSAYTTVAGDFSGNLALHINNGSAINVTVAPSLTTDTQPVLIVQMGAGQVTLVAGAGVTINSAAGSLKLRGQFSAVTLVETATNTFLAVGDLVA